jgi:hypothetical protein
VQRDGALTLCRGWLGDDAQIRIVVTLIGNNSLEACLFCCEFKIDE